MSEEVKATKKPKWDADREYLVQHHVCSTVEDALDWAKRHGAPKAAMKRILVAVEEICINHPAMH